MILCTAPGCQTTAGCQCAKWFDEFSARLTREYKDRQVRLYRPEEVERLVAAAEARGAEQAAEDTERLDWMIAHSAHVFHSKDGEFCGVLLGPTWDGDTQRPADGKRYPDARQAIDAARAHLDAEGGGR